MSISTLSDSNPLTRAADQLRDICREHGHLAVPFDAGSLARMLVHIGNINHSVLASTEDHSNASKRLNDFAITLRRVASHLASKDSNVALRMNGVASDLAAAGAELGRGAVPAWQPTAR
jgi:hypothetical protein